jgi:hypothetical protein
MRGYRFLIIERDGTIATRQAWLNGIVVDDGDLSPVGPDDPNVIDAMETPGGAVVLQSMSDPGLKASVSLIFTREHDELKAMLRLLLTAAAPNVLSDVEATRAKELAGEGPEWQAPAVDAAGT